MITNSEINRVCNSMYGVSLKNGSTTTIIWAAEKVADKFGVDTAKAELREVNKWRHKNGLPLAYLPYGHRLATN